MTNRALPHLPALGRAMIHIAAVIAVAWVLSGCSNASTASPEIRSQDGPEYASEETRRIIERMIDAHGGYEKWASAPAISYDNIFYNPFAQPEEDPWWYATEVIDQDARTVYQNWRADRATLVFDGEVTWTTGWVQPNPPGFMAQFFYYFINLPWLTQDEGVILSEPERAALPGFEESFYAIDMSFREAPSAVKSGLDTYRLFIHPESYRLQAYHYHVGFAAMLDAMGVPEGQVMGPMFRVHDEFVEVDGLLFPRRMHTGPPDASETWGYHLMARYSTTREFDPAWLDMPENAVIDTSPRDR